jgi:hypothetical protein
LHAKASKGLARAAQVLAFLAEHDRDSFDAALADMLGRAKGRQARLATGAAALARAQPQLAIAGAGRRRCADRVNSPAQADVRSKTAMLSTCAVCGNMFTDPAARQR